MNSNGTLPVVTKEQVEAYKLQRMKECQMALEKILTEYDCEMIGVAQIVDGRIVTIIQLKAK